MPLRKPLAIVVTLFTLGLCAYATWADVYIQQGVVALLTFVAPVVLGGYYASSTYEHCKWLEVEKYGRR